MKNRFLASLALAAMIAAPATAADLPYKAPPPLAEAYYDWSGAYVGLNVGGTHYNVTHHFPSPGAVTPDVTTGDHDAIFGIHAGAQWQWGAWVLGAELARSGCSHECRSTSSVLPVAQGFEENIFGEHKIIDLFTAGARLGYAWDRLLVFATGGFASAHIDVILGVEYQHFDVGAARAFCVNPGCVVPAVRDFDLSATGDIVRARLTIKTHGYGFGPPAGVGG